MLGKLLKYDFKWINKTMYVYFIILFILSIAVKIVESMEQTLILVIIDKTLSSMFISCIVSIVITCVLRIWGRFIKTVYKDESYLTHTLPVTKNQILNAKVLASILSLALSALVIFVCIAFVYINETTITMIQSMYQSLVDVYSGVFAVFFIIGIVLLIFLEIVYFMMAGIFGIVVGYRSNNLKTLKAIIIGIVSYGVLSTISFIVLVIMSKFVDFEIVSDGFPSLSAIKVIGLTFIIVYLIYNLIYYFASKTILNKGVNVE